MGTMNEHIHYLIKIKDHLDTHWQDWFDGLTIILTNDGSTILSGVIVDQAALHSVLKKIRNLGLTIISVNPQKKEKKMETKELKKTAKMAGYLYFIYFVIHIFADVFGRSKIIVFGDAGATAQNIMTSEWQFRIGIMSDLFAAVCFLLTAWVLYGLLKPVNKNFALLFLLLNLGGVAIQCFSDLFLIASQLLLNGADYLKVFQADQLQALAMLFLYLYKNGFMIAQIFYGAWLFPLGYLVFKSDFLPKFLGIALMVHCATWLMTSLQFFLFPGFNAITYVSYPLGFIAEFGLTLWLLIMGAKDQPSNLAQ
jgi:hypothetical protein